MLRYLIDYLRTVFDATGASCVIVKLEKWNESKNKTFMKDKQGGVNKTYIFPSLTCWIDLLKVLNLDICKTP